MFTGMEMMACHDLAVPAEVMQHVVNVESGSNPYAIGVVGARLIRQPQNLDEALATVRMLDTKGFNYSLGAAQVNRANLGRYGLDSYEKAFKLCPNLSAGANILAACYHRSGGDWGKAFSCYYSGNFVGGYRDGYVQKVYDSMGRSAGIDRSNSQAPIPRHILQHRRRDSRETGFMPVPAEQASYRISLRSLPTDTALAAPLPEAAAESDQRTGAIKAAPTQWESGLNSVNEASAAAASRIATDARTPASTETASAIFVPQVRGANDPLPASAQIAQIPVKSEPLADGADLRGESRDGAFVF